MRVTRRPSPGRCLAYSFLAVLAPFAFASCGDDATAPDAEPQGSGLVAISPTTTITGKVGGQVAGVAVRALDDQMRPIAGVTVRFQLDSERLPATSITTGADGAARLPTFPRSLLIGTEVLTATDIATGDAVTFELVSTPDPMAVLVGAGLEPIVAVGSTVTLPALRLTNGLPVEGAAVSYRIVGGGGQLSNEAAMTDATGTSEAVTLTLAERGVTTVEIRAEGYYPQRVSTTAVVPPVVFALPGGCLDENNCPQFDASGFLWLDLEIEVRDAVGPVAGFPALLTPLPYTVPDSPGYGWGGPGPQARTEWTSASGVFHLFWENLRTATLTLSGPLIEETWTFRFGDVDRYQ